MIKYVPFKQNNVLFKNYYTISVRENKAAFCISLTNLARLKSFTHGKTLH